VQDGAFAISDSRQQADAVLDIIQPSTIPWKTNLTRNLLIIGAALAALIVPATAQANLENKCGVKPDSGDLIYSPDGLADEGAATPRYIADKAKFDACSARYKSAPHKPHKHRVTAAERAVNGANRAVERQLQWDYGRSSIVDCQPRGYHRYGCWVSLLTDPYIGTRGAAKVTQIGEHYRVSYRIYW
jgi:hypothetical protein